ncbi:MAG: alpha-D-xyloside xylohydrolase [Francisellaceae bacterium]|jgi:alpha-D-xyloside xylohydrolase
MSGFSVTVPQWNDIPQLSIIGLGALAENNKVKLVTEQGDLFISLLDIGVRFQIGEQRQFDYQMIKKLPATDAISAEFFDDKTVIKSRSHTLIIDHIPFHFTLHKKEKLVQQTPKDGHFVREFRLPPLAKVDDGWFISLDLGSSEPVYGLGEKWGKLDKRGQLIRSYNHDALGVNAEISYKNVPFSWSPNGWGVFVHTPAPVTQAVGYAPWSQRSYGLLIEDYSLDLFILSAPSGAEMLNTYTELTGKAPTPPDWSLGVILSKAYYKDVPELLATAKAVREHNMPCDVITLDGRAWQDTDTRFAFEWDKTRYDDPAAVIAELKAMNFKVCIWEYPMISVENDLFDELASKGWLIKDKRTGEAFQYDWDMSAFGEVLTPLPKSGILDFTHPEAYIFWRDSHKPLFDLGVDMIKADFGEQIEDNNMVASNGECGDALHNVYTLLYNRCVYDAAKMYSKNGPFLFSRSAWTGSQCYPAQWGGDPQADWGGLAASLRGGQSWGLSGSPFYATDVGGFYKDTRDAELFVRWIQASVFSAHMRLHGIGQREPWAYGKTAESAANKALALRYQLLPYLKKTMQQATQTGLPVQRAMVLAFPEDKAAWAFEDQYMFGDDLLVVPCLAPSGDIEFYLPQGQWYLFNAESSDDIQEFVGGQMHNLTMPLDQIAVFIQSNKKIALGASVEHTEQLDDIENIVAYWPA